MLIMKLGGCYCKHVSEKGLVAANSFISLSFCHIQWEDNHLHLPLDKVIMKALRKLYYFGTFISSDEISVEDLIKVTSFFLSWYTGAKLYYRKLILKLCSLLYVYIYIKIRMTVMVAHSLIVIVFLTATLHVLLLQLCKWSSSINASFVLMKFYVG